jgi:hypothetical protein
MAARPLTEPLVLAAIGGLFLSIMNLYQDYQKPKAQRIEKDRLFFLFFFFWPVAGAVLAYVYIESGYDIYGWLAFTLGLTAPTTLQAIIKTASHSEQPPPRAEPP